MPYEDSYSECGMLSMLALIISSYKLKKRMKNISLDFKLRWKIIVFTETSSQAILKVRRKIPLKISEVK